MAADGKRHQPARTLVHEEGAGDQHAVDEVVQSRSRHHGRRGRAPRMSLAASLVPVMREDPLQKQKEQDRADHDESQIMRLDPGHLKGLGNEVRERNCGKQPAGDREELLGEARKPSAGKQRGNGNRKDSRQNACGKDV